MLKSKLVEKEMVEIVGKKKMEMQMISRNI